MNWQQNPGSQKEAGLFIMDRQVKWCFIPIRIIFGSAAIVNHKNIKKGGDTCAK